MIRKIFALLALVGLAAAPMAGWAASATYDGTLTVNAWSQGGGTVAVSQDTTAGEYGESKSSSYQQTASAISSILLPGFKSFTFYAFAKPAEGYKFAGWFTSAACEGSPESDVADGYAVTFSVNKNASDAKTYFAKFVSEASKVNVKDAEITLDPSSANYTGSEQTTAVTVKYGTTTLTENTDYTVSGDKTATGSPTEDKTYTVTITAVDGSDYEGSAEKTWTIKAPSGSFGEQALSTTAKGCELVDGVIKVTDSTALEYVAENKWRANAIIKFPVTLPTTSTTQDDPKVKYIDEAHVLIESTVGSVTKDIKNKQYKAFVVLGDHNYIDTITWTVDIPLADVKAAAEEKKDALEYEISAGALAWTHSEGIKPTTFKLVVPLEGLVLNDEEGDQVYPNAHKHLWGDCAATGDTLTVNCTNENTDCSVEGRKITLTLTAADYDYNGKAPTVSLDGKDDFDQHLKERVSYGTVTYEKPTYSQGNDQWYTGDYTAKCEVTIAAAEDGGSTEKFTLTKAFKITKPENGYTSGFEVSDISFKTTQEALDFAPDGGTVVCHSEIEGVTLDFKTDNDVTLDLNKKTLTGDNAMTIKNTGSGTVTLTGGTFQQPYKTGIGMGAKQVTISEGKFVFADLTLKNVATQGDNHFTVTVSGGTKLKVTSGTFEAEIKGSEEDVEISGGSFALHISVLIGSDYDLPAPDAKLLAQDRIILSEKSGNTTTYTVVEHKHNYVYGAVDNVITAVCDAVNHESCGFGVQKLTLTAENKVADGSPYTDAKVETDAGFPVKGAEIVYYTKDDQSNPLPGAPDDSGEYVAKVTVEGVTAEKEFQITHEHAFEFDAAGDTLTATCTAAGLCDAKTLTLTLVADSRDWQKATPLEASVTDGFGETIAHTFGGYVYYKKGEEEPLEGAPILTGAYTVKVTVTAPRGGGAAGTVDYTLTKDFEIRKPEDGYKAGFEVEGGLCYDTFADALAAAGEDETLCYHEKIDNTAKFEFTSAKNITIDLCDNELTYSQSKDDASDITIVNSGDGIVTLKNGKIVQPKGQKWLGVYYDVFYNVNVVGKFVFGEGMVVESVGKKDDFLVVTASAAEKQQKVMLTAVQEKTLTITDGLYRTKFAGGVEIKGGNFTEDPSEFIPDGFAIGKQVEEGYPYSVIEHEHEFQYAVNGNVITEICTGEPNEGECFYNNNAVTLTLVADDAKESLDGSAYAAKLNIHDAFVTDVTAADIEYWQGTKKLDSAPSAVGEYEARITVGSETAVKKFRILDRARPFDFSKIKVTGAGDSKCYELAGTTLTVTNGGWKYYSAENAPDGSKIEGWYAGLTVTWPNEDFSLSGFNFTGPEYAKFTVNGIKAKDSEEKRIFCGTNDIPGIAVETAGFKLFSLDLTQVTSFTWYERLTVQDVKQASGDTIERQITAWGEKWKKHAGGDYLGTDYGDTDGVSNTTFMIIADLKDLTLVDGDGYTVWPEHEHEWSYEANENSITARCTIVEGKCRYSDYPVWAKIVPTDKAEKLCDSTPLTAWVDNGVTFAGATDATVGEVEYWQGATKLDAAPTQPGVYTAKSIVTLKDGVTAYTLKTTLTIRAGQVVVDGVHYEKAEEQLERKYAAQITFLNPNDFNEPLYISLGKDFAAERAYVIPDAKLDFLDRLPMKTLDLAGFTVTGALNKAIIDNKGRLTICDSSEAKTGTLRPDPASDPATPLIINEKGATLLIEGGTFLGPITNKDDAVATAITITGGAFIERPVDAWVAEGCNVIKRGDLYYVEKHIHDYVFLPIGRSLMSATCKNLLVDDSDKLIEISHCDAREVLVALAVHQEKSFDLLGGLIDLPPVDLPTRKVEYTGEPVEAEVFAYNLSAFTTLFENKGLEELKNYISGEFNLEAITEKIRGIIENGWTDENGAEGMAILTRIGEMIGDLGYDTSEFIITREKALAITGLEVSEVSYVNTDTGAALDSAPVTAGNYRATAKVTTLKGNEITRTWDFSITATSLEKAVVTCDPLTKSFAYDKTEKTIKVTKVTVGGVLIEGYNNADELIQAFKEGKLDAQALYDIFKSFSTSTKDFLGKLWNLIIGKITIEDLRADLEKAFKITTLVEGQDYVITGTTNATDIGTYEFAVEGIGNYTGAKKITWAIKPDCTWEFEQDGATLTATCKKHGDNCPLGKTASVGLVPAAAATHAYNRKAIEAVLEGADLFALYTEATIGAIYYTREGETAKLPVAPSAVGKYTAHVDITTPGVLDLSVLEKTWTLEIPLEITEGVPTREFGKDAMSFSDLDNLEYDAEKGVWNLVIRVDWPERLTQVLKEPQFTSPENAIIERYVNDESADAPDEVGTLEIETGKFFRLKDVAMEEYVKSVTWTIPLTADELEAIREGGAEHLPFVLKCGAKVWENDLEGLIEKDFTVDLDLTTLELYDDTGKRCYPAHDHVWAFNQVSDTELKATCSGKNNCPVGNELSLVLKAKTVTEKAYNGISLVAVLEGADAFRKHTGLTVGEVKYYELGEDGERAEKPLCWAPTAPGKYVAVVAVTGDGVGEGGSTELVLPLTINPLDAECMHVYFKTDCTKFVYNAEKQGPEIHSVWYGLVPLVKGVHYTVEGDRATDVGEYTLKVTGIGKFEGEQTFPWSIVASTRPFGKFAMKVVRGVSDPIFNPLTRKWTCLVTVDWPHDIEQILSAPQFTDCCHAIVKKDNCGGKAELQSGVFYRIKDFALESYVREVIWTIDLDPDELQKAKDEGQHEIVRTITCSALPWANDPDGLCPTEFKFTIPLDCLKLYDEYGRQCFPVHKHEWSYELSEDKSRLTALCGNKSCPVGMASLKLNAKDKLYDAEPGVATLAGEKEFWIHTDAEIGRIQYFDEKGCPLLKAPVMPGKYVAKVLVKTGGCREHYTLEKKFEIKYHDFTKADVWMTDDCRVFIFRGTPIRLDVDFVTCGCRWLIEGVDYVVDCRSVTCAKEVGEYEIIVRGIGAYRGEQTIKWKIIWPQREFGKDTLKPVPGTCGKPWAKVGKDGKTVTVANWSNLHYDAKTGTWYAPVTIDWPKAVGPCDLIPQFTDPSVAVIELSTQPGKVFSGKDIALGFTRGEVLTCTVGDVFWQSCCLFVPYLNTVTWAPSFTMDDIVDAYANGEDHLEFDITVCSPAWAGDPCGLKRTTYTIIIPINPIQIVIGGVPQPVDPSKPLDPGDPADPESSRSGVRSAVKTYDGQPTNIVVDVNIPATGYMIKYSTDYEDGVGGTWGTTNPTFRNAGTNAVWYVVEAPGFVPVTNVQYVVIAPRPVTLASGTAEKYWDGDPLANDVAWAKVGSFVEGEGFVATVTGSQTDIGWSYNFFTWTPASGTLAANYDVTVEYGTLTVNRRNEDEEDPLPPEKIIETEPGTVKAEVDNTKAGEFATDTMPEALHAIAESTPKESMEDDVSIRLCISTQVVVSAVSDVTQQIVRAARDRGESETRIKQFRYKPVDLSLWRDYATYRNGVLIEHMVSDIGNENDVNLEVELPFAYTRRMLDVEVWRMHDDGHVERIKRLGLGEPQDDDPDAKAEGLYFKIDMKRSRIHVCAKKFSTYVIKYRLAETPQLTATMKWQYCQAISSFCGKFTVACTNGNPKLIKNVRYLFEDRGDNAYLVKPGKTAKLDTTITYGSHTFRYVETDEMFWKQLRDSEYDTECVWGVTQDIASTRYSVPSAQRKICMRVLNGRVTLADAGYDVQAERLAEFLGYITWQVEGEGDRVYWLPLGKDFAKLEVDNANLIIETAEDLGMGPMSLETIRLSSIVGVPVSEDGEAEKPTLTISEFSMNGEFVTGAVKTELRGVKGVPRQNATVTIMGSANLSDKFHKVGSAPVGKGGRFSFRKPEGINFIKVNLEY